MSAIVARTAGMYRGYAPGGRAARVTHALLVIAVTVVPPGVRGTCLGCLLPGGSHACCAGPTAAAPPACDAAAVAATHGCGSHASADPGMPTDVMSAARVPTCSVADAADGGPHFPGDCSCRLAPRARTGAGPGLRPPTAGGVVTPPGESAAMDVLPATPAVAGDTTAWVAPRPFRVLYGVWRN